MLLADGDTGWHIRTGDWILAHRAVPHVDLFSFTKPNEPWYAWEWGSDVLFALIHHKSGLTGVAFASCLILCFVSALLFRLIRRHSQNDFLSLALTLIALCGSAIHWLARPHLISWLFVLIFLHVLLSAEQGRPDRLVWLPAMTILWANLHAGFVAGFVLIAIAGIGAALARLTTSRNAWLEAFRAARPYLLCTAGCLLASFVNPYTWHLHQHVFTYLRDARLLANIQEYQSISFHNASAIFFEIMLMLGCAAALWCFQSHRFAGFLMIVLWAHFALVSARNIPLYLFVATPCIASMLPDICRNLTLVRRLSQTMSELSHFEKMPRLYALSVLSVVLLSYMSFASNSELAARFDPHRFPESAIPFVASSKGRVFTTDQWGDYLIYRLYPSVRVFYDGRNDFYGTEFVTKYLGVLNGQYDCEQQLERFRIATVVVKPDAPLASVLKNSRRWSLVFDDHSAVVFRARHALERADSADASFSKVSLVSLDGERGLTGSVSLQVRCSRSQTSIEERRRI